MSELFSVKWSITEQWMISQQWWMCFGIYLKFMGFATLKIFVGVSWDLPSVPLKFSIHQLARLNNSIRLRYLPKTETFSIYFYFWSLLNVLQLKMSSNWRKLTIILVDRSCSNKLWCSVYLNNISAPEKIPRAT